MQGFLEVRSGPRAGNKIRLDPEQLLRVGRTARADLTFSEDSHMSGVHFSVGSEGKTYRLTDLNSRNGTLVNGQSVNTVVLGDGDTIVAGETTFAVRVEADDAAVTGAPAVASPAANPQQHLLGLLRSEFQPLYGVLDAGRDVRILALLLHYKEECQSLYEGAEAADLAQAAPYLVRLGPNSALLDALVKEGWGKSWGIYLTSAGDFQGLLRHLRHYLHAKLPAGEQVYFRFYDPRVLRVFLPSCSDDEANYFFGPVARYVVEGEEPDKLCEFSTAGRGAEKKIISLVPAPGEDNKAMTAVAHLGGSVQSERQTTERPAFGKS